MSKMIIVKKGSNPTAPNPCPWVVDMPAESKR